MMTRVSETVPIQVTIGCPEGLDVAALVRAITSCYRGPDGQRVVVRTGGDLPAGMILLESR